MQVEDVTGVSLTTGRTTEEQRHLTVSNGLLGQVVVDDQSCVFVSTRVIGEKRIDLPCLPLSRNHSPMAQPEKGARYWSGAASDAVAATTMEYFIDLLHLRF